MELVSPTPIRKSVLIDHLRCRYSIVLVCFLGVISIQCTRVSFNIALVAMVNSTSTISTTITSTNDSSKTECLDYMNASTSGPQQGGNFNWNAVIQGHLLGAFFYGYVITQLPGGLLAQRLGAKIVLVGGILGTSVLSLLNVPAAEVSPWLLFVIRLLEGLCQGGVYPATKELLSKWLPQSERSRCTSAIWAGGQLGVTISLASSGVMAETFGWQWVFYIHGSLGCLCTALFMFLVYNTPGKHPFISTAEKSFIEGSIGVPAKRIPIRSVPCKSMLTSLPFLSTVIVHISNYWAESTLLTLPLYMDQILHFQMTNNGLFTALPSLGMAVSLACSGVAADYLQERKIMSTTNIRKMFVDIGALLPAVGLFVVGYVGCKSELIVFLFVFALSFSGISVSAIAVNYLEIVPAYTGACFGIGNTLATSTGIFGPLVVGVLTNNQSTMIQWRKVFIIAATIKLIASIVYSLFGSGEEQSWAKPLCPPDMDAKGRATPLIENKVV